MRFLCAGGEGVNGSFHSADGAPLLNQTKFPDGTAGLVQYGHQRGVKMGFYVNNCMCSERGLSAGFADKVYASTAEFLGSQGWDEIKIDSCSQYHNLSKWNALIEAKGKALVTENCHDQWNWDWFNSSNGELECPMHFFRVSVRGLYKSTHTTADTSCILPCMP